MLYETSRSSMSGGARSPEHGEAHVHRQSQEPSSGRPDVAKGHTEGLQVLARLVERLVDLLTGKRRLVGRESTDRLSRTGLGCLRLLVGLGLLRCHGLLADPSELLELPGHFARLVQLLGLGMLLPVMNRFHGLSPLEGAPP